MFWRVFQVAVVVGFVWLNHERWLEDGGEENAHIALLIGTFFAWFFTIMLNRWAELLLRLWARLSAPRPRPPHIGQAQRQIGSTSSPLRFLGETLQDRPRRRVG